MDHAFRHRFSTGLRRSVNRDYQKYACRTRLSDGGVVSSPVVSGVAAYFGALDGKLYAVSTKA